MLHELIAVQVGRRRFERRSEQLCEHARLAKERKRHREKLAAAEQKAQVMEGALTLVAHQFPLVSQSLGIVRRQLVDPISQAIVHMRLASCPKFKGAFARHHAASQIWSTRLVAACLLDQQDEYVDGVLQQEEVTRAEPNP